MENGCQLVFMFSAICANSAIKCPRKKEKGEEQIEFHSDCIILGLAINQIKHGDTMRDSIIFKVTDNGTGIDIEKAQNIIATTTESQHIGLRNIYRRIELYFGSVDMRFSSIPYFKNTITITIPFTVLEQSDSP
jgi:signal transduction histidine kinase